MKYWMDETSGVTVCKMNVHTDSEGKSPRDHAADFIMGKMLRSFMGFYNLPSETRERQRRYLYALVLPAVDRNVKMEYSGKARCMAPDIWDSARGREVARAKCLRNFYVDLGLAAAEVRSALASMNYAVATMSRKAMGSAEYWNDKTADSE